MRKIVFSNLNENNNKSQADIKNNINSMISVEELNNITEGQYYDMNYSSHYNNIPNSVETENITL